MSVGLSACVVCGGPAGACSDTMIKAVPLTIAGKPEGSGQWKSGRFFTTTTRVFKNNRLVYGVGSAIPWAEAAELGLVEPEPPRYPPVHAPEVVEVTGEDGEKETTQVVNPQAVAAVKRRTKKANPSGGLRVK